MSAPGEPLTTRLRHRLGWATRRQAWQEGAAGLLLLGAMIAAVSLRNVMSRSTQVVLWGLLIVASVALSRRGWLKLFGPVLFYDMICSARRARYALLRCLYALLLLLMLYAVYQGHRERMNQGGLDARRIAALSESFFYTFMTVQFLAVALLTPAYLAGAIAEEKDRKTLEFLLATDLRNREIVLSKQASRLANLTLLVLTGIPILGITQFLGGVDPDLMLAGFAATGLTMLGIGSVSILCSVYARKARSAIVFTYLVMVSYLALSGTLSMLVWAYPTVAAQPVTFGSTPILIQDLVGWFNLANPIAVVRRLAASLWQQQAIADVLPDLLLEYAIFYGILTSICTVWAILALRAVAVHQTYGAPRKRSRGFRAKQRPAVGDRPMVWKEVHTDAGLHLHWVGRAVVLLLVGLSFVPLVIILVTMESGGRGSRMEIGWAVNSWVRIVGTLVACLILLGVAVRAAGSVTGERERQTFDSLLTTPLDSDDILVGKCVGSIVGVRWGWLWLGLIWGVAVLAGGLSIVAIVLLAIAWVIYASFIAVFGLYCSLVGRTTLRATLATVGGVAVCWFGHWLPWICCLPTGGRASESLALFQGIGLTPPITLGWLAFHGREFEHTWSRSGEMIVYAIIGLILWGAPTAALWVFTSQRFRTVTRRQGFMEASVPRDVPAMR
jgi:ABC-type transport system involved in multi-copper enzyme maturation permease subunit